jgi:hypothetical protein
MEHISMTKKNNYRTIQTLLASTNQEELIHGLKLVKEEIRKIGSDEAKSLFQMLSTIFFIDPLDRPDLVPILDEAITLVTGFGNWIIPVLINNLRSSDIKAQMAIAHALGRIGADAIAPLMTEYQSSSNPKNKEPLLYALSKIKSPKIIKAIRLAIEAAQSSDLGLCDTGTRTIGKFIESIPKHHLAEKIRLKIMKTLHKNLSHSDSGIRAKAVRSFGKMIKFDYLKKEEQNKLKTILNIIIGKNDEYEWDHAYIVRKEAKEALGYIDNC